MSIRASCFAAFGVLLCLNLVSGWKGADRTLPPAPPRPEPSWRLSGSNRAPENSRTFGGRSESDEDEELMSDGDDLVLTAKQYKRLYGGVMGRSAGQTAGTPWTGGVIPYEILPGLFTQDQVADIKRGMRTWERLTCVRFREAGRNDEKRMVLTKDGGCYALLGMTGGSQNCSLADGCFYLGTVEHELGHTMGLIHEHQRPNRDDYVKINYFAVKNDAIFQLNKYAKNSDDKLGLPYDYHSVMHYDKTSFTRQPHLQTIYSRDNSKTDVIGMVTGPSFYDIKLVNLMYNCKDRCTNPPACREPCFVNEKCQCYCESDAPQEVCQDLDNSCPRLAQNGNCGANNAFMLDNCRRSCGLCTVDGSVPQLPCVDTTWCFESHCSDPQRSKSCKKTCNLCEDNSIQPRCRDSLRDCKQRAKNGECDSNPEMMLKQCTRSCDFCLGQRLPRATCEDADTMCEYLKANRACTLIPAKMSQFCKKSCNNCDDHVVLPDYCVDYSPHCLSVAWSNKCQKYAQTCRRSCTYCGLNV